MSVLRPITAADHAEVLALNRANVELLSPLDDARLVELCKIADLACVISHQGAFAGFVLTFVAGTSYDSVNYQWFGRAYRDFYYLDRIVLDDRFRRLGLGGRAYDEVEARARAHGRMALEVNIEPPNLASLAFHAGRGYLEVGTQESHGHVVSLQVLQLPIS